MKYHGFTLIEVLLVVAVISLISSIVLASLQEARLNAQDSSNVAEAQQMKRALMLYHNQADTFPSTSGNVYNEQTQEYNQRLAELVDAEAISDVPTSATTDPNRYVTMFNERVAVFEVQLNNPDNHPMNNSCNVDWITDADYTNDDLDFRSRWERVGPDCYSLKVIEVTGFDPATGDWDVLEIGKNIASYNSGLGICSFATAVTPQEKWVKNGDGTCTYTDFTDGQNGINPDSTSASCPDLFQSLAVGYVAATESVCTEGEGYCVCAQS